MKGMAENSTSQNYLFQVSIDDKYGYIDITGKIVIDPQFEEGGEFSEGLSDVLIEDNFGYIDTTGKLVIAPQFYQAGSFDGNLATVSFDGEKKGYIDKTGRLIIIPQFDDVRTFSEGLAAVRVGKQWSFINQIGEVMFGCDCSYTYLYCENLAVAQIGKK